MYNNSNNSFKFVQGMEVSHVASLTQKLFVKDLKWKYEDKDKNDPKAGKFKFLEGIIVNWSHNGELKEGMFHSGLLLPWDVAKLGQQVADEWLAENNRPLYNKVNEMTQLANTKAREIAAKYV